MHTLENLKVQWHLADAVEKGFFECVIEQLIASHCAPGQKLVAGRVRVFEPNPGSAATLCRWASSALCDHEIELSDYSGTATPRLYRCYSSPHDFSHLGVLMTDHATAAVKPMDAIDIGAAAFIKIDADGEECRLLKTARRAFYATACRA